MTYARHSWLLSSEGSLACNTYCDTGHPFVWSSPRTRDIHCWCCQEFDSSTVATYFNDLGLSRQGIEPRSRACVANVLPLSHGGGHSEMETSSLPAIKVLHMFGLKVGTNGVWACFAIPAGTYLFLYIIFTYFFCSSTWNDKQQ